MKQKRYWLRGAIVLVGVHTVVFFGFILIFNPDGLGFIPLVLMGLPLSLIQEPLINLFPVSVFRFFDHSTTGVLAITFVINTIQWFSVGVFLGWIYGKIKNRNQVLFL